MPKPATIALSMISMPTPVGLLIARRGGAAGVAVAIAAAFDFVPVRRLIADVKSRRES